MQNMDYATETCKNVASAQVLDTEKWSVVLWYLSEKTFGYKLLFVTPYPPVSCMQDFTIPAG